MFKDCTFIWHTLTLKGRGYFSNEKNGGEGAIMAPTFISARSNGLVVKGRGSFFQGTNIL